jgi:virginiamycin A acetyltransferase
MVIKRIVQGIAFVMVFPAALLCGFGRIRMLFNVFGQSYALVPGVPGDYLRIAFYRLTLESCSLESRISFGAFFAHPEARVGERVYIGSYSILGRVDIGPRTQIASAVQILSGKGQHTRDAEGHISGSDKGAFTRVSIGADCWIGAGAIVMADVGNNTTIGAGAVVTKPVPANSTAVGNPARLLA